VLKETILKYAQYNIWANQRILNEILVAGEEKADKEIASSFPSVRKTLYHIYDAESIWLSRLRNENADWPASKNFSGTLNEFAVLMIEKSKKFVSYVVSLDEKTLAENFIYKNNAGKEFSNARFDSIFHCMNHSTYHRGQLVTMLRIAGHTHFETLDFIAYCRV
jgi:uncharacterized damage-inducible protein DinB